MEADPIKSIAKYEIIETIRDVPECILLKAIETVSKDTVLIKIYYPLLEWSETTLNEFFNRISYLKFIEHENLLAIVDFGKYLNAPYLVYPYYSLELTEYVSHELGEREALNLFHEIAETLDFLHKQEIVHGSLNPQNILIDPEGNPKLFDYGINEILRRLLSENLEDGFDNLSVLNVNCSAPEQLLGRNPTRSSDVYSYGMTLYFAVYEDFPYEPRSVPDIAIWHLNSEVTWLRQFPNRISKDILQLIQKCIQVQPEDRFANFTEILGVLDRLSNRKRIHLSFRRRLRVGVPRGRSRRVWWYLGLLLLLLLAGFSSRLYFHYPGVKTQLSADSPDFILTSEGLQTPTPLPSEAPTKLQQGLGNAVSTQLPAIQDAPKPALEGEVSDIPTEELSTTNLQNVREFARLGFGKPEDVAVSPDSAFFALANSGGVFIYQDNRLSKWIDPRGWATSVQFSSDGSILAIGLISGEIQLWDWTKDIKLYTLSGHSAKISRILFSSNNRLLYSSSYDQHIIVWDLKSQKAIHDILAHSVPVKDIAVSSDGRTLASCAADQLVRIWDLATGNKIFEYPFAGDLQAVALSSDGVYLAAGGGSGIIRQWNMKTHQVRTDPIPVLKRIWSLQYVENDSRLFVGVDDGAIISYDAAQIKHEGISLDFEIAPVLSSLIQIFGTDFDFSSRSLWRGLAENAISINWDGKVSNGSGEILGPYYDSLDRLDFSKDGTILAAGGKRGVTNVWEIKSNNAIYKDQVGLPYGDPISPNGSSIVIVVPKISRLSSPRAAPLTYYSYQSLNLSGTNIRRDFSEALPDGVVSYADNGNIFISGSLNKSKVWDNASGYATFYKGYPYNGCWITASANNEEILQVYSLAGTFLTLDERAKNICSQSFSKRGFLSALSKNLNFIVYATPNGSLQAFGTSSNQALWKLQLDGKITAMTISPDDSIIAVGTQGGRLMFVDGTKGQLLLDIVANYGAMGAIKFSENGDMVATAGNDGVVRLFGVLPQK